MPQAKGKKVTREMGHGTAVLQALIRNYKNVEVEAGDIAEDAGITRTQAVAAIQNLKKNSDITSPRKGWYLYRGPLNGGQAITVKAKAEVVSMLNDGRLAINVEGRLGIWKEVEA
jgi:hypothetical protein